MKVLVLNLLPESLEQVKELLPKNWNVLCYEKAFENEVIYEIGDADAIIVGNFDVTKRVIDAASRLRIIQSQFVGVDNIDVNAAVERGILVANAAGGNAISVAEHTLLLMLAYTLLP